MKRKYIICGTSEKLIFDKLIFRGLKLIENIEMLISPKSFINDKCAPGTSGIRIIKYPSGQLWISESYKDGKLDGERKVLSLDGSLWRRELYKDGKLDGECKEWSQNRLCIHAFYRNGEYHGERKCWHEGSDKLSIQEFWQNGIPEGECKTWHANGQLKQELFYRNGKPDGKYEKWYSSGQILLSEFYRNGMPEGERKIWYENGQLREHSVLRDSELTRKEWYSDGQRMSWGVCHNNKHEGKYTFWFPGGGVSKLVFYRRGKRTGEYKQYLNGEIHKHHYFDFDMILDYHFSSRKKLILLQFKNELYFRMMRKRSFLMDSFLISDLTISTSKYL